MPKKRKRQIQYFKPRLHIFCEGEKTEPNYLNGYLEGHCPGTRLMVVEKTNKNTPVQLVKVAINAKKDKKNNPDGDIFWVVYDRESTTKYPNSLHAEALGMAKQHGVNIALSNVCFEVWILLHFQNTSAPYDSYDDLYKHSNLKQYIPKYDKGTKRKFSTEEIKNARKHAKVLNENTENGAAPNWTKPHQWNPYTDVYKLLDAIDEFTVKHI